MEHLVGFGLLLAFLLPHTSTVFLMVNPLLCLALAFLSSGRRSTIYYWIVLVPLVISLVLNMAGVVEQKAILTWLTIVMYFTLFPFVGAVKVRNSYLMICLGFIIVSQLVYLLNIDFLTSFIDSTYPISSDDMSIYNSMRSNISYENIMNYRLGGIYRNPNQCSRYLVFLLAFYIVTNKEKPIRKQLLFVALASIAVIFTGSRTGLGVVAILLFFGYFRRSDLSAAYKFFIVIGVVLVGIYFVASGLSEIRSLDFRRGFSGSFELKWVTFYYYFVNEDSIPALLFGHFDPEQFENLTYFGMSSFDTDYGNLIFCYGIVGFLSMFVFWFCVGKKMKPFSRLFFLILFWMLGSTLIMSYRSCFIFQLMLSLLYSYDRKQITT